MHDLNRLPLILEYPYLLFGVRDVHGNSSVDHQLCPCSPAPHLARVPNGPGQVGAGDPGGALKAGPLWTGCPKGGCEYSWGMGTPAHRAICGPSAPLWMPHVRSGSPSTLSVIYSPHPTNASIRKVCSQAELTFSPCSPSQHDVTDDPQRVGGDDG